MDNRDPPVTQEALSACLEALPEEPGTKTSQIFYYSTLSELPGSLLVASCQELQARPWGAPRSKFGNCELATRS